MELMEISMLLLLLLLLLLIMMMIMIWHIPIHSVSLSNVMPHCFTCYLQAYAILASSGATSAAVVIDNHTAAQHIQHMQDQQDQQDQQNHTHQYHTPSGTDAAGAFTFTGDEEEEKKQDDEGTDYNDYYDDGSGSMDVVLDNTEFEFTYDPLQQQAAQLREGQNAGGCMDHHHHHHAGDYGLMEATAAVAAQAGAGHQEDAGRRGGSRGGFDDELGSKNRPRSVRAGAADGAGNTTPPQMPAAPAIASEGHAPASRPAGALYYGTDSSTGSSGDEHEQKGPSHQPLLVKMPLQQAPLLPV
jgi:hypothetical protein